VLSSITIAFVSTCALFGGQKQFHPGPASSYAHQVSDNVVIGASVFDKPDQIEEAFGKKIDFHRYGIVPVLVVIENNRKQTLDLRSIEVNIVGEDGRHASAMKPDDIQFLAGNGQRSNQIPTPIHLPKRKGGITSLEVAERAFTAEMVAPGDSASGFFYFSASPEAGDKLYINGLQEAPSGRDITFFEFPFQP
jgi:hypothetical protein